MAEHAGKPKVRFAGFTEAWEQRELSYWATRYDHLRIPITASNRVSGTTPYYGANGIQDYVSGYTHDGEFILVAEDGANDLKNYPVQYVSGKIWVNNHAHVLQANTNIADNKFLKFAISQANIEPFLVGGGRSKLNAEIMMKISILAPKNIQEQARIGTFFRHLDRLITLHQRKRGRLENIKKAMLEKMFPKNGADVPEIRFAGFTEAWEQRKVGNLIEDYVERTTIQNQYPVLTSSQQQGIVLQEAYFADRQVTTNDNVGYFVLPKGYFTYRSRSDTDVFVFNRNDILDKGIISYYYPVFQTKYTCSDFLLRRLNHGIRKQLAMAAEGTGQKVLAHSKFKNMTVSVPKIGEQQKIGTFFRQLDRLVTLHQRKVTLLQNIKKACLEKMFV